MAEQPATGTPVQRTVQRRNDIAPALDAAGIRRERPVVVLVGGADGLADTDREAVASVLRDVVLPLLADRSGAVVDGGTDSGVMRLVGQARDAGGGVSLVGVAAQGTVSAPGATAPPTGTATLEPNHDAVLLVPGREWGDESPWIADTAGVLAGSAGVVTVLVNGGDVTYVDAGLALLAGRPLLVLEGTGRAADAIAAGKRGGHPDPRAADVGRSELTTAVPVRDPDRVRNELESALRAEPAPAGRLARFGQSLPGAPALLKRFPTPWYSPQSGPVVPPGTLAAHPVLAEDMAALEQHVTPDFREADLAALREQNAHRFQQVLVLIGSVVLSALAALQALWPDQRWPGIVVTVLAAGLLCASRINRELSTLDRFLDERKRAERLRALHFEYLSSERPTGSDPTAELRRAVVAIRTGREPALARPANDAGNEAGR